jgi:hypothetical protein
VWEQKTMTNSMLMLPANGLKIKFPNQLQELAHMAMCANTTSGCTQGNYLQCHMEILHVKQTPSSSSQNRWEIIFKVM